MELHEDSLLATLLTVKVVDSKFRVVIAGDGVVAARLRNTSKWIVLEYQYPSGAPFYLRYLLDPAVEKNYINMFGTSAKQHRFDIDCSNGSIDEGFTAVFDKKEEGSLGPYYMDFDIDDYDAVAILSDGTSSFLNSEAGVPVSVPLHSVLCEVLNFKNYSGAFVQRRCKAAFKKFSASNWHNSDDFSMGVVYHPETVATI